MSESFEYLVRRTGITSVLFGVRELPHMLYLEKRFPYPEWLGPGPYCEYAEKRNDKLVDDFDLVSWTKACKS